MDKKTSKIAPKWGFPPLVTPRNFFQKLGSLTYGALTSCKKLEKTNERSLIYLKMDQWTTDYRQRRLLRTTSEKEPGVQQEGKTKKN